MAIDEAGFTPEFFKGDNVRDLFEGDANVADVIAPVAVTDSKEIEKVSFAARPGTVSARVRKILIF